MILKKIKENKLSFFIFVLAIILGGIFRFGLLSNYIDFKFDQARDAEVYMQMWEGNFPTLGPSASGNLFSLPPNYYYLIFPFTVFGSDPIYSLIPNTLFSFLSIILIAFLVNRLLQNIEEKKRLLISSGIAFWWSIFRLDIISSQKAWNPVPIPFFVLAFLFLTDYLKNKNGFRLSFGFGWVLLGFVVSMLIGMHSSTMVVIPVLFEGFCLWYLYQHRNFRLVLFPFLANFVVFLSLIPYFVGELATNWQNTRYLLAPARRLLNLVSLDWIIVLAVLTAAMCLLMFVVVRRGILLDRIKHTYSHIPKSIRVIIPVLIFAAVFGFSLYKPIDDSPFIYFKKFLFPYTYLSQNDLFPTIKITFLHIFFSAAILSYVTWECRSNKFLLALLGCLYIMLGTAVAFYDGRVYMHYIALVWFVPFLLTANILGSLQMRNIFEKGIVLFIIGFMCHSIFLNVRGNISFLYDLKLSTVRFLDSRDISKILQTIPRSSEICIDEYDHYYLSYVYIDKYMSKQSHIYLKSCEHADYYVWARNQVQPLEHEFDRILIEDSSYVVYTR